VLQPTMPPPMMTRRAWSSMRGKILRKGCALVYNYS
jgi:hypothetical protein